LPLTTLTVVELLSSALIVLVRLSYAQEMPLQECWFWAGCGIDRSSDDRV
jgi:hypothetical protein